MKIYYECDLDVFEAWSGGADTLSSLLYEQVCQLNAMLPDIFGDEVGRTELNDFLWFERDKIADLLGFESWEDLEHYNAGDEKVWNVYIVSTGGVKHLLTSFDDEYDANDFCDEHDWEYADENEFVWELEIEEEWTNVGEH